MKVGMKKYTQQQAVVNFGQSKFTEKVAARESVKNGILLTTRYVVVAADF